MLTRFLNPVRVNVRREGDSVVAATFSNERKGSGVKLAGDVVAALGGVKTLGVELIPGRAGRFVIAAGETPLFPDQRLIHQRKATAAEGVALILGMMESEDIGVFGRIRAAQDALKDCDRRGSSISSLRLRYPEVFGDKKKLSTLLPIFNVYN